LFFNPISEGDEMIIWKKSELFLFGLYSFLVLLGVVGGVLSVVFALPLINSSTIFALGGGGGILLVLIQRENTNDETFELRFKMYPVMNVLFLGVIVFLAYRDPTDSLLIPFILCLFLQVICFVIDPAGLIARIDNVNARRNQFGGAD
jgi:hypothetical protein